MHFHDIVPDIRPSGEPENILATNYRCFSSSVELWEIVCQISCRKTIKILLRFPAFTFNKPKRWSISAPNTKANSAVFIMKGRGHLNFAIPQGDHMVVAKATYQFMDEGRKA